ncbi:uncharacterized protein LOC113212537 [Frankliniella occidentalis]|uniref:Uncharacterized protein LOC113212537 n=1 Tax=Frankliniella occidentalis TaxID=133901 RepID=A0A6J1T8R6_FRAOC|nr:uncharacterized protein LOC113212537 [Frankliniella occidentalis]
MEARDGRPRGETDARGQQAREEAHGERQERQERQEQQEPQQQQEGRHRQQEEQGPARGPWGDPSSGWLFHAPGPWPAARRGPSSERFGIFRDSGRSRMAHAGGPSRSAKGARRHATRWAVIAAMTAMLTLFVCLLLVDFTRSEPVSRVAVNATSHTEDEAGLAAGAEVPGRDQGHGQGGRQGREDTATVAPNHRYPHHFSHRHLLLPPRLHHGRSLKTHQTTGGAQPTLDERWEDRSEKPLEDEQYDDDEEDDDDDAYTEAFSHSAVGRAYRSLHLGDGAEDEEVLDSAMPGHEENVPPGHGGGAFDTSERDDNTPEDISGDSTLSLGGEATAADDVGDSATRDSAKPKPFQPPGEALLRSLATLTAGTSHPDEQMKLHPSGDADELHEYPAAPAARKLVLERPLEAEPTAQAPTPAEDRSDEGHGELAVALPYQGSLDMRWPGALPDERDRDRERWAELVRMQQQGATARKSAHHRQDAQRKNFFAELGTIQGEQFMLPHYPQVQDNLGPVLFPSSSKQQSDTAPAPHFVPKKLMKMMGGTRPWPAYQSHPSQNQYLVVNNKGVVIPHSVNFPDIVKTANYPQLQNYRNQQSSRNIQDILNYLKGGKRRPSSWNAAALKKAAKVSGMYSTSPSSQLSDYDMLSYPRPEPYVKDLVSSAEASDKPDFYNGHAYIADPFHPYKPSDPTEINQMASTLDSDTSASMSSERMRHPVFVDEVGEPFAPRPPPFAFPGRYGRYRHPFLQAGAGAAQYTEATFKPLGGEVPVAASDTMGVVRAGSTDGTSVTSGKSVPPLSIMLEIFPMGEAKTKEGAATVMWNNFPVAALRPVIRRPPSSPTQGLGAQGTQSIASSIGSSIGSALQQAEASLRRPQISLPVEGAASSHATTSTRFPVLMQGQLSAGQGQPAFGVTLSGVQGLQNLAGLPMMDSKHRMVVHLNFYPKKTVKMPMRFRELGGGDNIGAGASFIPGGTFSQRRQSAHGAVEEADPAGSIAVDVAPLLRSLPPDMQSHLAAILQTYERATALGSARDDQDDVSSVEESDEDYLDDNAGGSGESTLFSKRQQHSLSAGAVDAEPSPSGGGSSSEEDARVAGSPMAHWLLGRERPWPSQSAAEHSKKSSTATLPAPPQAAVPKDRSQQGSYFDVQDDEMDLMDKSRPGEIDQSLEHVADDEVSPAKATDRVLQDIETSLSPQERLLLWRHWKEMQALQRREQHQLQQLQQQLQQRDDQRKRKKQLQRTQRMDSTEDTSAEETSVERTVPKNHRLD